MNFICFPGDAVDDQVRDKSLKYAKELLRRQQDDGKDLFELPAQASLMESDDTEGEEQAEVVSLEEDSNDAAGPSGQEQPFAIQNVRSRFSFVHFDQNLPVKWRWFQIEDLDQEVFEALPADIKIEILTNYKEKLKSRKSHSFEQFPEVSFEKFPPGLGKLSHHLSIW